VKALGSSDTSGAKRCQNTAAIANPTSASKKAFNDPPLGMESLFPALQE